MRLAVASFSGGGMLRELLEKYRAGSKSEREKGAYFERLVKAWLESAPTQKDQFSRVLTFAEWAGERREDKRDTGIDLCAQLADDPDSWCAIQCKFYAHGYKLQKGDIDSFFTASGKRPFTRRIIVDTTDAAWSEHAETALNDQIVPTIRIGLSDLEESGIDWALFAAEGVVRLEAKKKIRDDQKEALDAVIAGLAEADRGKLIMACGTGKTFTALKIAETMVGAGGRVLYLVPSLALMSQTVREWSIDADTSLRSFAVCSDAQVGVRRGRNDDLADIDVHDLEIPATTQSSKLAAKAIENAPDRMTVVFSTYQSIQVISEAQKKYDLPEFDLIVCDEAHRTTGVTLEGQDESNFVRIHNQDYIAGKRRLYMTATPRIYGDGVQATAREVNAALCSMDDASLYGETLFTRNFSWAVQKGLLTDYKVIVLAVDEAAVSASVQARLSDENNELKLDDATKIIGCYRALTKADLAADVAGDTGAMRRALAFTRDIKSSKLFRNEFARVADDWRDYVAAENPDTLIPPLNCEVEHVDGTFNATARGQRLSWLKENTENDDLCRILTNARCLSEGVDVPALDAIMFLHPRKSQIDVVQSVGRVMRRAEGKKMGYVILPVGVPAGVPPEQALDDNEKYKVVWQILNALRAHDDRLDATINKIEYGANPGDRIEVIAVTNTLPNRTKAATDGLGIGRGGGAGDHEPGDDFQQGRGGEQLQFLFDDFAKAILSRIVKKCGTRTYWEDWANDVAEIARKHVTRLTVAVEKAGSKEKQAFDDFLSEIQDDLNDSITAEEAIEMLAQHMITRPVFEALFENYSFASENPVSKALQGVLDVLDEQGLEKETESLERFYASVRLRAKGIEDAGAKQRIVKELYDKFFRTAFPKLAERMGIVYTPIEIVDFIIKSVNEVLQSEFKQTLGSKGVHIIDPFTGTGTFITRLLQSGLIKTEEMAHKYANEIHANEILLLAYYIAAINIEATYHELSGGDYKPFPGICLTDTFQLYEKDDLVSALMADNSSRRAKQKKLPIKVIFGNPPYSSGQKSANDNAGNLDYPGLDKRIAETYAAKSSATLKNSLYDSYIRALRWGSDRLVEGGGGVMAFVTNAGWLDGNSADGLRRCFVDEFSSIHVFHLRGNQRTQGEQSRKEGGKIFGQGSRAAIAITVLVCNPESEVRGRIRFHDIGDYLSREQKLAIIERFGSIEGIDEAGGWREITPNEEGDWLRQRDASFGAFLVMGDKTDSEPAMMFANYSGGVMTNRDAWCINPSRSDVARNMAEMIKNYNGEVERFEALGQRFENSKARETFVSSFVTPDPTKISWSAGLKSCVAKGVRLKFEPGAIVPIIYRPFSRQWFYFDGRLNERTLQMRKLFPSSDAQNLLIMVKGRWSGQGQLALMVDSIAEQQTDGGAQCFPRYVYDVTDGGEESDGGLFSSSSEARVRGSAVRKDAITDGAVAYFEELYGEGVVTKDDVFYYTYAMLHSEDYRSRYVDNLAKELPRIPRVKSVQDFRAFVEAGRTLAKLHVKFDEAEPYPLQVREGDFRFANIDDPAAYFRVEKMKFGGRRGSVDKSTVVYNPRITLDGIPLDAYEYVVNGKPALEWVMERQSVKTEPASGIISDANRYANETVGDPMYPLTLFQRMITVSLETMKIVRSLPVLEIAEGGQDVAP